MKFIDHGLTPAHYQYKFLDYVDILAPEVLETLTAMSGKYGEVINDYPYSNWLTDGITEEDEILDENEILHYLQVKDRYHLEENDDIDLWNRKALDNYYSLRNTFLTFIKKFGLETDWLRRDMFKLLGDINRYPNYMTSLSLSHSHAWFPKVGDEFKFVYKGWEIELDSRDYEKRLRGEFEKHLKSHIESTIKQFKKEGYKQATKPLDFNSVKWLVYWTVLKKSKKEILIMIDEEHFSQGKEVIDIKTLEAHFRKFKKYGLPVRG